ncbi:hypothetical protein JMUB6875_17030 [Nocardia sp. JMUB6875]
MSAQTFRGILRGNASHRARHTDAILVSGEVRDACRVWEKAKDARLQLLLKLRSADPDYYTQTRLARLSGMSQQNVSHLLSKPPTPTA